jgi:hypothetical protein
MILKGEPVDNIVDSLIMEIGELLEELLRKSVSLAIEREGEDIDILLPFILQGVEQCSLDYYLDALDRYKSILLDEIRFAIEQGYISDISTFLSNPQGYMAGKKGGLQGLKDAVKDAGQGVSYSFRENLSKIGISISMLSYANAELWLWRRAGEIVGYYGKRNSNYPCPLCDDYAYMFIPIEQGMIYPLHNRCVCSIVPLRQGEILL